MHLQTLTASGLSTECQPVLPITRRLPTGSSLSIGCPMSRTKHFSSPAESTQRVSGDRRGLDCHHPLRSRRFGSSVGSIMKYAVRNELAVSASNLAKHKSSDVTLSLNTV